MAIFMIASFLNVDCWSQKITAHRGDVKNGYNYWFVEPENPDGLKPLVIFLHGQSLCGNDLNKVKRYGTLDAVEKGRDIDAFVLAPQNPGGSWDPEKIMNIVDYLVDNNDKIDQNRIYVLGMSLGGYGTLDFAATYPDEIAAAIAMCGGATKKNVGGLNEMPLWIIHGTADTAVPISKSDKVVNEMRAANGHTPRLAYDRIPGMNHSQPARVFYMPETYEWLFSHSLLDEGRPITKTFDVSSKMGGAYGGLKFSGSKNKSSASSKSSASTKASSSKKASSKKDSSKKASTKKSAKPSKSVKNKKK